MANTSRPSLGSQIKDFGTKTHFFSKKSEKKCVSCHFKESIVNSEVTLDNLFQE